AGLMLSAPAWENMLLGRHWDKRFSSWFSLKREAIRDYGQDLIGDYDIRPADLDQPAEAFSGGNQQKIVVGREIAKEPRILVAAHLTRGVDLAAAALIHAKIRQAARRGAGVLLISADLDEILSLSDRIIVLFSGRIVGETPRKQADLGQIGQW